MNQEPKKYGRQDDEVSFGEFFDFIAQGLSNLVNKIKKGLEKLRHMVLYILYFTMKKWFVFISLILLSLLVEGYFKDKPHRPAILSDQYEYNMLLKIDHILLEQIKSDINYYNLLLKEEDYTSLSEELEVDLPAIKTIITFKLVEEKDNFFKITIILISRTIQSQIETGILNTLRRIDPSLKRELELQKNVLEAREKAILKVISTNNENQDQIKYYQELKEIQQNIQSFDPILIYSHFSKLGKQIVSQCTRISFVIACGYMFFILVWLVKYIKTYLKKNFQ